MNRKTSPDIAHMAAEVVAVGAGLGTVHAALRDAFQMGRYGLSYDQLKAAQAKELAALIGHAQRDDEVIF